MSKQVIRLFTQKRLSSQITKELEPKNLNGATKIVNFADIPSVSNYKLLQNGNPLSVPSQSSNYPQTWSDSQRPKNQAMIGARFEQTDFELQPNPMSAQALIEQEPIRLVNDNKAACDGDGGALGHPKIWIPLDKPGVHSCSTYKEGDCVRLTL